MVADPGLLGRGRPLAGRPDRGLATDEGFLLQRISDKAVLGRYRLPLVPAQLQFLASQRSLLAWGGYNYGTGTNRMFLVTLP